jgi:AcrR family transcriptional regulator
MKSRSAAPRGRQVQAARNDDLILEAARAVFLADPTAPISAVAARAGVGIAALYRRYPSKKELLRTLCAEGLQRYITITEAALADDRGSWEVFTGWLESVVDADTNSLVQRLAGTFTPTDDMYRAVEEADRLNKTLFARVSAAGVLRRDFEVNDLAMVFQMVGAVRGVDGESTRRLRHRYLALVLNALRQPSAEPLPGVPPTFSDLEQRWRP